MTSLEPCSPPNSSVVFHDVTIWLKFINFLRGDIIRYEQTCHCGLLVAPALGTGFILKAGCSASDGGVTALALCLLQLSL